MTDLDVGYDMGEYRGPVSDKWKHDLKKLAMKVQVEYFNYKAELKKMEEKGEISDVSESSDEQIQWVHDEIEDGQDDA